MGRDRWCWGLIARVCLADRRAHRHHNRHDAGFEFGAAPDHGDLELTKEAEL